MSSTVLSSTIRKRATCTLSSCENGTSGLFGFTRPGASFIDASRSRSSARRAGTIGASTMKFDCGIIPLLEHLVAVRLVVRHRVHRLPERCERLIDPPARAALIAERAMFGNAMPRVVAQLSRKRDLRRRIEFLLRNAERRDRHARREPLRPQHGVVLDRHQER